MINTSIEFQKQHERNSSCLTKANILLKDGTLLEVGRANISQGTTKIDDGVTGTSSFDIGSAIINKLTLSLNNLYDTYSDYDFTDAVVTAWVGKQLSDRMEWLKKGVYNAEDPTATAAILTLECADNMSKFDTVYKGGVNFPATLQALVRQCCTQCGVLLLNSQFPNYAYKINADPFGETNITCRAIISYCAMISGCYARCNADGRLEFKWYDTAAFDGITDGGVFDATTETRYQTGANLDGGTFTDYRSGDTADGGSFTEVLPYHHIYSFSSLSISTEDVVITGIRVKASDSQDDGNKIEGEMYLCGTEGYVLEISQNPLVEFGKAKVVAEYLAERIVGMRFRPFTASAIGDPSWEAGDAAVVTDRKGNSYHTYLTNITYSTGGYTSISCDAEPAARHSADRYAEINKIVADMKKDSQQKLDAYSQYVDQMNSLAINAMGYYETNETQSDGSIINYMHDKPLMSESTIIYKKSIDGFFISRDGGKTYVGGMDKDANIVANVVAAIGISFDWAKGGTLTLGGINNASGKLEVLDANGEQIGKWDNSGATITGNLIQSTKGYGSKGTINSKSGSFSITDKSASLNYVTSKQTVYGLAINSSGNEYDESVFIVPATSSGIAYGNNAPRSKSGILSSGRLVIGAGVDGQIGTNILDMDEASLNLIHTSLSGEGYSVSLMNDRIYAGYRSPSGYSQLFDAIGSLASNGASATFNGFLTCRGGKSRLVETSQYGERLLYCYEMPSPMFGDIGEASTDENGLCYISIDDIFTNVSRTDIQYHVFLQKEGAGDIWVSEKKENYFIVKGTPNLSFSWEIKCKQVGFELERMDDYAAREESLNNNESLYMDVVGHIDNIDDILNEQEDFFNEEIQGAYLLIQEMEEMYYEAVE